MTLADELMGLLPIPSRKGRIVQPMPPVKMLYGLPLDQRRISRLENERKVLEMVEEGLSRAAIATELGITRRYVNRCYQRGSKAMRP